MQYWFRRLVAVVLVAIVLTMFPEAAALQAGTIDLPSAGDVPYQAANGAPDYAPAAGPSDPRPDPPDGFDVSIAEQTVGTAPGYCPSSGGSSQYEFITFANFTQSPGGTWQLEVQVFIANPGGCTAGEPCESYDPSPENVNAWIDWNGDKVWEASEQVMDVALTGYSGINYQGTMTGIAQFSQPEIITDTTWARVNLGWGSDPGACTPTWAWGNVVDQELNIGGPKIKEIKVKGSKDAANPMTMYDVELDAVLDIPPDYEVVKVSWSGDLKPGDGDPYTYKPDKNTHGKKKIKATLTYRHIPSGVTGTVAKEHEFKLFFEKKGDDDGNGKPNWFEYWGPDGAVSGLTNPIVQFDSTKGAGQYGSWNPPTDKVDLGAAAAEIHYPGGLTIDGVTYGNVKGIDSVSEVIGHELRHRTTNHNWNAGGPWAGKTDTDKGVPTVAYWDLLPDDYEDTFGTDKTKTDSKDLEHKKSAVYKFYGDNEFDAIVAGHGFRGVADKDWANPGSQSTPPFKTMIALAAELAYAESLQATSGPVNAASLFSAHEVVLPGLVNLTGDYSDSGLNTDGDAEIEALRIVVEVDVTAPDHYAVVGWLQNGSGQDVAWAQRTLYLNAGTQNVNLDFDGTLLFAEGVSTTYILKRVEVRGGEHGDLIALAENAYATAIYDAGNFSPPAVTFTNSFAESAEDTNTDGLFDALNIDVGVTVRQPGAYTVVGWLYDKDGNQIPGASASAAFDASGVKRLAFDGQSIRWHREDGPYVLQLVQVRNAALNPVVQLVNAFTTTLPYSATQFGPASILTIHDNSYVDAGEDVNDDGLFDYLSITLTVEATEAGTFQLQATLRSSDKQYLAGVDMPVTLSGGSNPVKIQFPGGLIRQLEVDGSYRVEAVSLSDSGGATLDYQALAHVTNPYSHTQFAMPLVQLTGSYRDYPVDTGGDAAADVLRIEVGVLPGNSGVVLAQAQLTDKNGVEIAWVNGSVAVTASVPATVTLNFSATDILTHGVDGPYLLRNLLVYHTGDPSQDVSVAEAHITAPYNHTNLTPLVIIGPPASVAVQILPATLPADGASQAAVVVTVQDATGNNIPNQVVNLVTDRGSLAPSSGKTNINGTVTVSLTAATIAGTGIVTANVGSISSIGTIAYVPGAPAELTLFVNPTQVSADGSSVISVAAVVRDAYGNLVGGQPVSFGTSAGSIGAAATTNNEGSAATQLVAPATKATATVTASIGGLVESAQVKFGDEEIFMPHLERQ